MRGSAGPEDRPLAPKGAPAEEENPKGRAGGLHDPQPADVQREACPWVGLTHRSSGRCGARARQGLSAMGTRASAARPGVGPEPPGPCIGTAALSSSGDCRGKPFPPAPAEALSCLPGRTRCTFNAGGQRDLVALNVPGRALEATPGRNRRQEQGAGGAGGPFFSSCHPRVYSQAVRAHSPRAGDAGPQAEAERAEADGLSSGGQTSAIRASSGTGKP